MKIRGGTIHQHRPGPHFEGLRRVSAISPTAGTTLAYRLATARLRCQRGGPGKLALDCLRCHHLVNFLPPPAGRRLEVRCVWTDEDPVRELMTVASAAIWARAAMPASTAANLAWWRGVQRLPVVEDETVVGVAERAVLECAGEGTLVLEVASPIGEVLSLDASLGDAVDLLSREPSGMALVAGPDLEFLGLLTRSDLRRCGIPDDVLGEGHGAAPFPP
jgi:CBS domain-containing protein